MNTVYNVNKIVIAAAIPIQNPKHIEKKMGETKLSKIRPVM